jgi:hypothetical protein
MRGTLLQRKKTATLPMDIDISTLITGIYIIILTGNQLVIPLKVSIP